ncbi:MAG: RNA polymerase sigma factor [Deltaproteobacteria bacterium]|nr:RNA polymerase sigma factor [Deltaproteobacteria bacterium]
MVFKWRRRASGKSAPSRQATAEGDAQQRFSDLMDLHGASLRAAVYQSCPEELRQHLEDIEQEARLRIWKAIQAERKFNNPKSYIYKVGVNATRDAVAKLRGRGAVETQLEPSTPETAPPAEEGTAGTDPRLWRRQVMASLERCLAKLAENRQLAVRLHLQGFSNQEVADMLSWSEPKARNLIYRGLTDLRRTLSEEGIDYEAPS